MPQNIFLRFILVPVLTLVCVPLRLPISIGVGLHLGLKDYFKKCKNLLKYVYNVVVHNKHYNIDL